MFSHFLASACLPPSCILHCLFSLWVLLCEGGEGGDVNSTFFHRLERFYFPPLAVPLSLPLPHLILIPPEIETVFRHICLLSFLFAPPLHPAKEGGRDIDSRTRKLRRSISLSRTIASRERRGEGCSFARSRHHAENYYVLHVH